MVRLRDVMLGLVGLVYLGCAPPPAAPTGAGAPTLGVQASGRGRVPVGPVQIAYFAPKGDSEVRVQVSVAFDRPMVALGSDVGAGDVLRIEPLVKVGGEANAQRVEGRARWVGSQTIVFEPKSDLRGATPYRVRVAKGTRALDGNVLADEFAFEFTTPEPKIVRQEPYDGAVRELPGRAFELFFNQAVSPEVVQRSASLVVEHEQADRALDFEVSRPNQADPKQIRITPKEKLPLASRVRLRLSGELTGEEGPTPMGSPFETSFSVYGPLQFAQGDICADLGGRCSPEGGTTIRFTNPVKIKDALKALRFDPPLPAPLHAYEEDYESEYVYISQELLPNTKYTVRLAGDVVDAYGNHFSGGRTRVLRTGPYPAWAHFLVDGDLLEAEGSSKLPLRISNLTAPKVHWYALKSNEIDELASGRRLLPKGQARISNLPSVPGDKRARFEVDPAPVLAGGKGVFLAAVTDHKNAREPYARTLLAVTNLAPSLKFGHQGGVVWVTDMAHARAVSDVEVRVSDCGNTLATGKTDASGMWHFKLARPPQCELFAIVQKGGDVSFTHQYAGVGPWDLSQHAGYEASGEHSAFVFSERGVYRPGETMRIKGVLRRHGAKGLRTSQGAIGLRVADSQDREIERLDLKLSEYGTFSHSVRVPGSVSLGPLSIAVRHEGQTFMTSAEVAEFRRAELEVDVRSEQEHLVRGQSAKLKIAAKYLFGAPVANQRVVWSARRVVRDARPPGESYDGFTFDDESRWFQEVHPPESTSLAGNEAKLDEGGELSLQVPAEMALESGAAGLEVEATVDGLGGATAAGRTVIAVTPAGFMVGLRPESTLVKPEQKFTLQLAAAKLDGTPVSKANLEVSLERRVYTSELKEGTAGRTERIYSHRDEVIATCQVATKRGFASCDLTAKAPGLHFVRVSARDSKGRLVKAALPLYAYGVGSASWQPSQGPVISMKTDRAHYRLGEKAKILVASPFEEAEALISVEREGVISVEQRHIVGNAATIEVPVDLRFVPNAFVTVLLVRPRRPATADDPGAPEFRVGSVEITTDVSEHHLKVKVLPDQTEKRPGEKLEVALEVVNPQGKPVKAELTVFAVDEGVLSLTGYRTPDPFEVIYAPRPLSVWTADARGRLARMGAPEEGKGGGEGGGGGDAMTMRKDFDALAFYAPDVITDDQGRARVSFKLPESLTRFRIMAVAASRGADVGAGEASVRTKKPLMLRPALPRVVRVGDALSAGVVVHNESDKDMEVALHADIQGLSLKGPNSRAIKVKQGSATEVRFAVQADAPGEAFLRITANTEGESDGLEVKRPVLLSRAMEAVSTTGETQAVTREALAALQGIRGDVGGLDVRVATTALLGLEAPALALINYAYGCTEQLSSRLIGMAGLARLSKRGVLESAGLEKRVEAALGELERHQRADGGFGLWSSEESYGAPSLTAFLTSYALLAMHETTLAGFSTSSLPQENARRWLAQYLRGEREREASQRDRASVAFVVYALARSGSADASYTGKLYEERDKLDLASRVELAHTLEILKESAQADRVLEAVLNRLRVTADEAHLEENWGDDYEALMVSDVRATAQLILLLLARDPAHTMLPRLARWLSDARELDGAWATTQENAWGMLALANYIDTLEQATPDFTVTARVGDQEVGSGELRGRKASQSFTVPMAKLPLTGSAVELEKRGRGVLHYTLRLSYARSGLPKAPEERGFYVERVYERIPASALAAGQTDGEAGARAEVGDYVRVTLRVAVPATRRFVVIEDPLPAGLEAVNFGLLTESQGAASALGLSHGPMDHAELRDGQSMFSVTQLEPGLYEYQYLTRATTPGAYVVPSAKVSEMYHPETFGSTAAGTFEVVAP